MKKSISKNEKIINEFIETLASYRHLTCDNFQSRQGDEESTTPLEEKIIDTFKRAPLKLQKELLLLVFVVLSEPAHNDRLENWLRKLAYVRYNELKKLM
jgi:hypothetical protein